jgi:hypothetical protein
MITTAITRARLSWHLADLEAAWAFAQQAKDALDQVGPAQRVEAGRAVATLTAFLASERGDSDAAERAFAGTVFSQAWSLGEFRRRVSTSWLSWFALRLPATQPISLPDETDVTSRRDEP